MLMLITYDIPWPTPKAKPALRRIAKHCLDYGVRVNTPYSNATSPPTNGCS